MTKYPPFFLSDVLKKEANNINILRLLAALAVIIGHAYAISPEPPLQDGVLSILHFDYSGSLAVKFFFFLSGLLVTNSIISNPNAFQFLAKRAIRIFPALLVCLLVTVFIVGPIFTTLPLKKYFSSTGTWTYIKNNFFLFELQFRLTGVFSDHKYGLNGSLWTLPYEVLCYIYLAISYGLGFLKNRTIANSVFIIIIAVSIIVPTYLPTFFSQNPDAHLLPACFALGGLFANNKGILRIDFYHFVILWLLSYVVKDSVGYQFVFYVTLFYSAIFISSLSFVINKLKIPFDASYGVYIYGFMIQQCVNSVFPHIGVHGNQVVSAIIVIGIGTLSWYYIEKPCLEFGHRVIKFDFSLILKKVLSFNFKKVKFQIKFFKYKENNISVFIFFTILAVVVHALVLRFIYPGYYSPLIPFHPDCYMPAALANSSEATYTGFFTAPRPITYDFMKLIGIFGIYGSIACVIALVCVNISLGFLLIKRILNISFSLFLIIVFIGYCYLLFSHPNFYIFYTQDIGTHLCYFFLLIGAYSYYNMFKKYCILSNIILFFCCLLSFFSKETYVLSALFVAFVWFIYYKKTSVLNASLPFLIIILAIGTMLIYNVRIHSTFVDLNAVKGTTYQINFNPLNILKEWFLYLKESYNLVNILIVFLIIVLLFSTKNEHKKEFILVALACVGAAFVAILPNALLPNHHFSGYSFNGSSLFYLPLLFIPILNVERKGRKIFLLTILAVLCFVSPILNISKYKYNNWSLVQEDTQRNLLNTLDALIKDIKPASKPEKILVQGITFPFCPFHHPQAIRVFPNAKFANFDIVRFDSPNKDRKDLVRFIMPADTGTNKYDQQWVFDNEGKLFLQMWAKNEMVFNTQITRNHSKKIDKNNFSKFVTTGFYDQENEIRWTNGNALIILDSAIANADSVVIALTTFLPAVCKKVIPTLQIFDLKNIAYKPFLTIKKGDVFYYSFEISKKEIIKKIEIVSDKIDSGSDPRPLSFPFLSLDIKY